MPRSRPARSACCRAGCPATQGDPLQVLEVVEVGAIERRHRGSTSPGTAASTKNIASRRRALQCRLGLGRGHGVAPVPMAATTISALASASASSSQAGSGSRRRAAASARARGDGPRPGCRCRPRAAPRPGTRPSRRGRSSSAPRRSSAPCTSRATSRAEAAIETGCPASAVSARTRPAAVGRRRAAPPARARRRPRPPRGARASSICSRICGSPRPWLSSAAAREEVARGLDAEIVEALGADIGRQGPGLLGQAAVTPRPRLPDRRRAPPPPGARRSPATMASARISEPEPAPRPV